jgi:hypothetical protein
MNELPKSCIFCDGKPLSREHIWAKWLRPYMPRLQGRASQVITRRRVISDDVREVTAGLSHGSTHGYSQTLKIVCHKCNNGWMSQIQTRAKPWLQALAQGKWSDLDVNAQQALAAWATMFTIVAEYLDPQATAIGRSERRLFRETQSALPGWRIWIGNYSKGTGRFHNHHTLRHEYTLVEPEHAGIPNTQTTGFNVGYVFFQTFSSTSALVEDDVTFAMQHGLRTIWPARSVVQPPVRQHDYASAIAASNDFVIRRGMKIPPRPSLPFRGNSR